MSVITITSDWGGSNPYIGAVKGTLLSYYLDAKIVDITHDVKLYDISNAAFILKNCFRSFPIGSVHVIAVNTEASTQTPHMLVKYEGHYFVGADTGVFSLIVEGEPEWIMELQVMQDSNYFTFSSRDVFAKVATHIVQGNAVEELGIKRSKYNELMSMKAYMDDTTIRGAIVFIDNFKNAITNIHESLFLEKKKGAKTVKILVRGYSFDKISTSYYDVDFGNSLVLFGSNGYLEIAMNQGYAASLMGLNLNDTVKIQFTY